MNKTRICIYPKDIQQVTGKSERTARRIFAEIREALGKDRSQYVSLSEFCSFTGLDETEVKKSLIF